MKHVRAPDRGSFPLDHFEECREIAERYNDCITINEGVPKKCRQLQKDYMECRMGKGLMKREPLESLGFTQETEWETEEAERRAAIERINQMTARVKKSVAEKVFAEQIRKKEEDKETDS